MAERPRKRKPRGKPLALTDMQLDALAEVTPADIQSAMALWDTYAPPDMRGLLDAKPAEDDA